VALLGIVFCCLGWMAGKAPLALADETIRVLENGHTVTFGREMRFSLQAESDNPIVSVVLAYRTSDTGETMVEVIDIDPNTSLRLEFVHQMSSRYVRPFVEVTYWWTIVDSAQARLVTESRQFVYADDRHVWQTLKGDVADVHWYYGEIEVAQQALEIVAQGLAYAREDIASDLPVGRISVYLYASREDLALALPPEAPSDAEAITLNGMNVILAAFPPLEMYIPDLQRVLPHEATHVLIYAATQGARGRVPLWLAEGLATFVQYGLMPDPVASTVLEEAVDRDELIPLLHLCAAFPVDAAEARLAYVESANIVAYVRDRYGSRALRELVAAYADGATCAGGVHRALGITLDGLEAQWRESLAPETKWSIFWRFNGSLVVLLVLVIVLPLAVVSPRRARTRARGEKVV
jgi:hypothetical protein